MRLPLLICGITLLDQLTKLWIRSSFAYGEQRVVIPGFFNLHHIHNTGAAWGMLAGWRIPLIAFSLIMLLLLIWRRRELFYGYRFGWVALGLLAGGIIGNLIDRVFLGYVVDFLDFHHGHWHFPAFNVADSAICIGIGLYLIGQFRAGREPTAVEQGSG
ncbi:MAG: signal peptidase II [Kiritimatiellia bacterium]|jgi:signal peptidase II